MSEYISECSNRVATIVFCGRRVLRQMHAVPRYAELHLMTASGASFYQAVLLTHLAGRLNSRREYARPPYVCMRVRSSDVESRQPSQCVGRTRPQSSSPTRPPGKPGSEIKTERLHIRFPLNITLLTQCETAIDASQDHFYKFLERSLNLP